MSENMEGFLKLLLEYELYASKSITITVGTLLFIAFILTITKAGLAFIRKATFKTASPEVKGRLKSVFKFVNYFVYLMMFFFILNAIGINISMFLTTSAALFVGLGFALQDIFRDLIAGIYILMDKTLNVGDVIELDNKVAKVQTINLRCTIVETRNKQSIVIPNRKLIDDFVNNWTHHTPVVRAKIELGVYIGTDAALVKKVLLNCVATNDDVLKDPSPLVFLDHFGESSIRFILYYFIDSVFDNDRIGSDIRFEIDRQFKQNGIALPVPVLRLASEK